MPQQRDRLTDAYLHGVIPLSEYERRRRELDQKDQALADQEQQVVQQAERRHELAGVAANLDDFCQRVQAGLATATFEQRRELVELLVDRVVVTDDDVEIRYVFPTQSSSEHVRFCHLRTHYFDSLTASDKRDGERRSRRLGRRSGSRLRRDVLAHTMSNRFKSDLLKADEHMRPRIAQALVKRLHVTQQQAMEDNGLCDECMNVRRGERRFRVSRAARIHYLEQASGSLLLCNYYGPSEHDDGL